MTKRLATTMHFYAGPFRVSARKVFVPADPSLQKARRRLAGHKSLLLRVSPERRAQLRAIEEQEISGPAGYKG